MNQVKRFLASLALLAAIPLFVVPALELAFGRNPAYALGMILIVLFSGATQMAIINDAPKRMRTLT